MTIELLNIDCMEYMKTLEDNAFDLAVDSFMNSGLGCMCVSISLEDGSPIVSHVDSKDIYCTVEELDEIKDK